jgi:hypothetical protein
MNDAFALLAEITALEDVTKKKMLAEGASHADIIFLFLRSQLLAERGLEDFPEQTFEFSKKLHHAREGAAMVDRHQREDRLEAAGIECEHEPESEIAELWAKVAFLQAVIKDLDSAITVLRDHTKLTHEMNTCVRAMVSTIAHIKELEETQ